MLALIGYGKQKRDNGLFQDREIKELTTKVLFLGLSFFLLFILSMQVIMCKGYPFGLKRLFAI